MLHAIDTHPKAEVRLFNPFDNRASIFGGRNVGDEYFGAAKDVGFGDMDALAIVPIAQEVSSQFDLYWNSQAVRGLS